MQFLNPNIWELSQIIETSVLTNDYFNLPEHDHSIFNIIFILQIVEFKWNWISQRTKSIIPQNKENFWWSNA